jgi:hypothetical protein
MKPRYLLDEHVNRAIQRQLRRLDVRLEVLAIGDPGAPSAGTSDPDLLVWLEKEGHILVTENRSTMPVHLAARYAAGGHIPGVFWIRPRAGLGAIIEEINVIKLGLLEAAERAPTPAFSADQTGGVGAASA